MTGSLKPIQNKNRREHGLKKIIIIESVLSGFVLEPGKDVTSVRRLGYEITEVPGYKSGELFVKQFLRPIYVQPVDLAETLFITASLPGRMLEKCMAGQSLLAQMTVDKYLDHLPILKSLLNQRFAGF